MADRVTGRPSGRCAATEVLDDWRRNAVEAQDPMERVVLNVCADQLEAALASPCCADQEQVKARCRSVEHHLDLVDIHDADEECNWARVEAAKSEITAALALLSSNEQEGGKS